MNDLDADLVAANYNAPFSLPPNWYFDRQIYRRETESVFHGSWRLAAHQSELARPGDFVTINFCDESLLILCDRHGALRGFFNVCQHRGHRLVDARRGHLEGTMICPYHAWATAWMGACTAQPIATRSRASITIGSD